MASHATPLRTQSTSSRLDRDNCHREFIDFVRRSLRDGINGLDETGQFIAPSLVRAWWTKPGERRISNALNPRSYTSSDTILRGYTMVFSVLVYIGRTQFIGDFIRLRFGDRQLPLLEHDRCRFGDDPAMTEMLDDFYNNQWKFTPIIFSSEEGMNLTLIDDERQILPIKEQRSLPSTAFNPKSIVRMVTLYPDCCPLEWGPQCTVVLKEYQTQKNEAYRESWNREYNAFALIESCEKVIKYLGSFEQNGRCFMMLEYADGGSLLDVFKRNVIPRTHDDLMRFWTALMDIFLAINRINNLGKNSEGERTGFAHRDINPSSILVFLGNGGPASPFSEGFKLKLADFDTATTLQSIDETELSAHDNHGTRTYCAPQASRVFRQQERDIMQDPFGCDVWSLGCVLSEALVWLAGGWEAIEAAASDRKLTISREHPEMKGSGYDTCFHDGTHVLQCVLSSHRAAVNKLGPEDILSPKVYHLIEGLIFLPEDSRPLQHSPMNIWAIFYTRIKGSIASVHSPAGSRSFFNERPFPEFPKPMTPESGSSFARDKALSLGNNPRYIGEGLARKINSMFSSLSVDTAMNHPNGATESRSNHTVRYGLPANAAPIDNTLDQLPPINHKGLGITPFDTNERPRTPVMQGHVARRENIPSLPRPTGVNHCDQFVPSNNGDELATDTLGTQNIEPSSLSQDVEGAVPYRNPDLYPFVTVEEVISHRKYQGKREDLDGYKSFQLLAQPRHFFVIVDDSESMRERVNEVCPTAEALFWILKVIDSEGVELRFTSDPTKRHPAMAMPIWLRSTDKLVKKIRHWFTTGDTQRFCNMELALNKIFNHDKVVDLKRPTSVLILTDGIWEGGRQPGGGVEAKITSVVRQMEKKEIPRTGFTIQFVSFGNDPAGLNRLKYLDDDAPYRNKKGEKVDIVDHKSSKASVWLMLIGAMSEGYDRDPFQLELQPSHSVFGEDPDTQPSISSLRPLITVTPKHTSSASHDFQSEERGDFVHMAARTLAHYLFADRTLRDLCVEVVHNFGKVRFFAEYDEILKIFFADLQTVTDNSIHEDVWSVLSWEHSRAITTSRQLELISSSVTGQAKRPLDRGLSSLGNMVIQHRAKGKLSATEPRNLPSRELFGDDSDKSEDDDEEDKHNVGLKMVNPQQLERSVAFFTTGPAFETLKSNLACLVRPPTTIREALDMQNLRALRILLSNKFSDVAKGDYLWLQELEDIGYKPDEMADLLFEEARDSPWIFFTTDLEPQPDVNIRADHHLPGCVHQLLLSRSSKNPTISSSKPPEADMLSAAAKEIQRYCGLGGIVPSSRDREIWNGFVNFEEENSVALVSYSHQKPPEILSRLLNALELCCRAFSIAQAANLCCQSFTILRQPAETKSNDGPHPDMAEMCRIKFDLVIRMHDEFRMLKLDGGAQSNHFTATRDLVECLGLQGLEIGPKHDIAVVLQIGCLCVQVLLIGFLSYIQGHVGPLRPFFLDTPLQRIRLLGCEMSPLVIEISLKELSCIGDMLRGLVLVFDGPRSLGGTSYQHDTVAKLDLFASPEDLVDTWGPGQFIMPTLSSTPSAVRLGGGVVFRSKDDRFHWSRNVSPSQFCQGILEPGSKIRIGTPLVTVNNNCKLKEGELWNTHSDKLEFLGTFLATWIQDELQVTGQVGTEYVVGQVTAGWHRLPGQTLKQEIYDLRNHERVLHRLGDHWAVQVSLCTGVARRVSLQEMVADLLPVFGSEIIQENRRQLWQQLRDNNIVEVFRSFDFINRLGKFDPSLFNLVLELVSQILGVLSKTGLDRQGQLLRVSWPYGSNTSRCFVIDLTQHKSSWVRLIADSVDCATFAYASPKCLETTKIKCFETNKTGCVETTTVQYRGRNSQWYKEIPLLETAVMVCSTHGALRHEETYFFQKMDELLFVKAVQQQAEGLVRVNLVGRMVNIPEKFRYRILERPLGLQPRTRLREEKEKTVVVLTAAPR